MKAWLQEAAGSTGREATLQGAQEGRLAGSLRVVTGTLFWFALPAALSLGSYLLASRIYYRIGFPLDDAWIHQTYARNLVLYREWAFVPGQPSAGSTAPLWSGLLALGDALGLGPYLWTFGLGWLSLAFLAVLGVNSVQQISPQAGIYARWGGVLLVFEWHLVWAAGSGMETLLFANLSLLVLLLLQRRGVNWLVLGALIGLSVWARPDGITLIGPAGLVILFTPGELKQRFKALLSLAGGILIFFLPYLLFNHILAGAWWPNTFFAKQAEYAVYQQRPLIDRLAGQAILPLVGVGALLLPGFLYLIWRAMKRRRWAVLGAAAWALGYLLLYAWRLPVTYQHGRYVMPAMPVLFLLGWSGMAEWLQVGSGNLWQRVASKTWLLSSAIVLLLFWGLGAQTYARDVAIIESEMVNTAQWVARNTPVQSLVAAHDIGALGYFAQRPLLDLAGLISPQVIPFIRNEAQLADFLDDQQADYLVTFPEWYPVLTQQSRLIYTSHAPFSPLLKGENMGVYSWGNR